MLEFVILIGVVSALIFTIISVGMTDTTDTTENSGSEVPLAKYGEKANKWYQEFGFKFDATKSSDGAHETNINYDTSDKNNNTHYSLLNMAVEILPPYMGNLGNDEIKYVKGEKGDKGDKGDPGDNSGGGGEGGGDTTIPNPTQPYPIDIHDLFKIENGAFNVTGGSGNGGAGGSGDGGDGTGQGGSSLSYSAVLNALYAAAANYQENGNKIPTWLSDSITYIDSADRKNDGQKEPLIAIYYNEAGGQQINAPVEVGGNGLNVGSQLAESTGTNTVPLINNKNTALNSTSRGDITYTPGKDGSETTPVYIGHSAGVNLKNEKN